jgi:transposase-like protein
VQFLEKNMPKRKRLSALQKAQIVLDAIREDKSAAQIATENSVHPNLIHKWKKTRAGRLCLAFRG